jgi:hypothetical protein
VDQEAKSTTMGMHILSKAITITYLTWTTIQACGKQSHSTMEEIHCKRHKNTVCERDCQRVTSSKSVNF